jgi:hypothetical protein
MRELQTPIWKLAIVMQAPQALATHRPISHEAHFVPKDASSKEASTGLILRNIILRIRQRWANYSSTGNSNTPTHKQKGKSKEGIRTWSPTHRTFNENPLPSSGTFTYVYEECVAVCKSEQQKNNRANSKRTTPGIPTWSPTVVLTWPDSA